MASIAPGHEVTAPERGPSAPLTQNGSVVGLAGATYLAMALGLVIGPLLARALGPAGRGEVASAVVYFTLATTVISLGVPLAISHDVANGVHGRGAVLATARRFAWWTVPPSLLVAVVVVEGPLHSMSTAGRVGVAALLAAVPLAVLLVCLNLFLIGGGALRGLARVQVVPVAMQAVATVVAYSLGVLTVGSYLVIVIATTLLSVIVAWRVVGVKPTSPVPLGSVVRFGLRGYAAYLAMFGSIRLDQAFVGPLIGSRMLGFYAVSATLSLLPCTLARAVASRSFATVAAVEPAERADKISEYVRLTLVTGGLCAVAIAAVSPVAIPLLYGEVFSRAVAPLLVLLPGAVLLCGSATASSCLVSAGRPGSSMVAELVGLAVTVVGLPLVLPRFGIVGAAGLSSAAYTVTFMVYRHELQRLGRTRVLPGLSDLRELLPVLRNRLAAARPGARA